MTDPQPTPPAYHRPADVARMLRCSEWWVKEQARKRRIPYSWIGGSYLFTDEHVIEIVRLFEVRPAPGGEQVPQRPARRTDRSAEGSVLTLTARIPRRLRNAA